MLDLVDHIIKHLIYFELIPQKKDRKIEKNKYIIDYIIQVGPPKNEEETLQLKNHIWQKKVYSKGQNASETFWIQASCFYKDHNLEYFLKESS